MNDNQKLIRMKRQPTEPELQQLRTAAHRAEFSPAISYPGLLFPQHWLFINGWNRLLDKQKTIVEMILDPAVDCWNNPLTADWFDGQIVSNSNRWQQALQQSDWEELHHAAHETCHWIQAKKEFERGQKSYALHNQ